MTLRNFFVGRAIVFTIILVLIAIFVGYTSFKNDIYRQKPAGNLGYDLVPTVSSTTPTGASSDPKRMTLNMKDATGNPHAWTWIVARMADGTEIRPAIGEEKAFSLKFKDNGEFIGTTDCNSMQGKFAADHKIEIDAAGNIEPRAIRFWDVFRTEMACGDSQEAVFASLVEGVESYIFTSRGELVLNRNDYGTLVLR